MTRRPEPPTMQELADIALAVRAFQGERALFNDGYEQARRLADRVMLSWPRIYAALEEYRRIVEAEAAPKPPRTGGNVVPLRPGRAAG